MFAARSWLCGSPRTCVAIRQTRSLRHAPQHVKMRSICQVTVNSAALRRHLSTSSGRQVIFRSHSENIQPATKSIFEMIWERRLRWGNQPAYICGMTDKTFTFEETYRNVLRLSDALHGRGYRHGDVIAAVLPNCVEQPTLVHACAARGMVTTTLNPLYTEEEMAHQLEMTEARAVVTHPTLMAPVSAAAARVASIKEVICTGDQGPSEGVVSFEDLLRRGREVTPTVDLDLKRDPVLLLFSSGTTGLPKGVVLTNYSIGSNLLQSTAQDFAWEELGRERFVGLLPMFHLAGMYLFTLKSLLVGASTVLLPRFEPQLLLDTIKKYQPTHLHLVPPLVTFLNNSPDVDQSTLASLKVLMCGAAPLGKELRKQLCNKMVNSFIFSEAYGLTEASPLITMTAVADALDDSGSCGSLLPNTELKVLSVDDGRELEYGENGELCIRGPQVMLGYHNNPEATAATIDDGGWLHTGDIGYIDQRGVVFIVDRVKELIKYKGFQVAPASLEDLLRKHAGVADVAVIGIPDEAAGELPRAYVVPRHGDVTPQELVDFTNSRVNKYYQLRGGVIFVDSIPKSTTGKILRRRLREMAERENHKA